MNQSHTAPHVLAVSLSAINIGLASNSASKRGTVTEAIYGAGYWFNSRFYAKSSEMLGMAPNRFATEGVMKGHPNQLTAQPAEVEKDQTPRINLTFRTVASFIWGM